MADQVTATERVRSAIAAGNAPGRKDIERALRESFGLSARAAKKFAAQGCRALGSAEDEGLEELMERLKALERLVKVV